MSYCVSQILSKKSRTRTLVDGLLNFYNFPNESKPFIFYTLIKMLFSAPENFYFFQNCTKIGSSPSLCFSKRLEVQMHFIWHELDIGQIQPAPSFESLTSKPRKFGPIRSQHFSCQCTRGFQLKGFFLESFIFVPKHDNFITYTLHSADTTRNLRCHFRLVRSQISAQSD